MTTASLLQNDSDANGDHLRISSVSAAIGGTVARTDDGIVSFKAQSGYSGAASFKYTISDGHGGSSTAVVSLNVAPVPAHTIIGTQGRDVLTSTHGDDIFIGKGGSDTFVFRPGNGHDQINDFQTRHACFGEHDVMDLRGNGFRNYNDLSTHIHSSGHDTLISMHDGGTILVKNVAPWMLSAEDFKV